nr:AAC(3)-I family aminoglycoside N-acetyltransferase [Diaminobutyricimonas sp. TR449]
MAAERLSYVHAMSEPVIITQLTPGDLPLMRSLNTLFSEAFDDPESYAAEPPSDGYLQAQLGKQHVIVLTASIGDTIAGGLVAYELDKLEQARSEVYIYDLAVAESFRRHGVATALIRRLQEIAAERGAWVVYVQADYGDEPAIGLYSKLGVREEVMHFDIPVPSTAPNR